MRKNYITGTVLSKTISEADPAILAELYVEVTAFIETEGGEIVEKTIILPRGMVEDRYINLDAILINSLSDPV